MKKNIVEVQCIGLDHMAKGLIQYQNKTYAISHLLPQEIAKVDLSDPKNPRLLEIIKLSKDRVQPCCDKYDQCGSCQLLHMTSSAQQDFKTNLVKNTFKPLHSLLKTNISSCVMAYDPWYYRNKVQMPISLNRRGRVVIGFYQENSIEIIENDNCLIQTKETQKVLAVVRQLIAKYHISAYDWYKKRGTLKYLLIRYGFTTQELMLVFVTNGPDFKFKKQFVTTLTKEIPEIKTIIQNINLRKDHLVLDRQENIWYGKGYITDYIGDVRFLISPKSFYQINPPQVKKLYDCIKAFANLTKQETVIDAYCGVGTIGLYLAKEAKAVYGVEMIVSAIDDAKKNAKLNHIRNAHFQVGDASQYMQQLAKQKQHVDVVIVDPPRSGCTPELMKAVLALQPSKFIYVSCNIETQVRDLQLLKKSPYKITKMQAFDLFPQTYHVETVVLLSKGEVDSKKIRVEFSLEDMDMSEFQDGATYAQLKDYVLEHSGLKVSNLYISQIKRKCGIGVGKNYNLPKSEDSRQPQCPPEKEKAIREAFKYFGMI